MAISKMNIKIFLTILSSLSYASNAYALVRLNVRGLRATIKNSLVELNFNPDSTISLINVGGKVIASVKERSFYLDWNSNGQIIFKPTSIHIVENTPARCHFYWLQKKIDNRFRIELHYIMVEDISGIYSYVKYANDKTYNLSLGETRMVYRFDSSIFTKGTNEARSGNLYTYSYLKYQPKMQDETWQLPDHSYFGKYDFAGYIRETNFQGVFGNGYGAFLISPSREYHGSGPLKQDLLVHQDALICNYFLSGHFGTSGLNAYPGWSHMYGPWLLYFNTGSSDNAIFSDVTRQAAVEKKNWPYGFIKDNDYPLLRATVAGTVSGQKSAMVVVWDETTQPIFEQQSLGYLYHTKTKHDGSFKIFNVRPGKYSIAAYPLAGHGSENLATKTIVVTAGGNAEVGDLFLPEPSNIIWNIGETNRRSDEFKLSNQPRSYFYESVPPANLTFIIGLSKTFNDWYYAQTKPGIWTIQYQDKRDDNGRTLRIALAAGSIKPHVVVSLNRHRIGDVYAGNDRAIYRGAMQSGVFSFSVLKANKAQVVSGTNTLTLQLSKGMVMYDAVSLQIS